MRECLDGERSIRSHVEDIPHFYPYDVPPGYKLPLWVDRDAIELGVLKSRGILDFPCCQAAELFPVQGFLAFCRGSCEPRRYFTFRVPVPRFS